MKEHLKLYLVIGLITLMVSACTVQTVQSSSDGSTTVGSSQSSASAGVAQAPTGGDTTTGNVPSQAERDQALNQVNRGAPIVVDPSAKVAGPQGGESGPVGLAKPPLSSQSENSQGTTAVSTTNILSQTIQALSNWFGGLFKSIFNS